MKPNLFFNILVITVSLVVLFAAWIIPTAWAGEWSAQIGVGAGWMKTESHLDPEDDNKRLDSLNQSPKSESDFLPVAAFEINYQISRQTGIYGGIPLENGPNPTLGFRHDTGRTGEFDLSVFYALPDEVWADPYLTGVNRTETDQDQYGAKLAYELGDFELSYEARFVDVDKDDIGVRLPNLKRDGTVHQLETGYGIELGQGFEITPSIGFVMADMDGKSNEYQGFSAGLTLQKFWQNWMMMVSIGGRVNEYDASHPVFNQTREDDILESMAVVSWFNPLGFDNFSLSFGAGYEKIDSNIRFYDEKQMMTFFMIGYRFGAGGPGQDDD